MKKFSLILGFIFAIIWSINLYLGHEDAKYISGTAEEENNPAKQHRSPASLKNDFKNNEDKIKRKNFMNLEKIGDVINSKTANLDENMKNQLRKERVKFDNEDNIKEKVVLLEQGFLDKNSSIKDLKRLQSDIQDAKNKLRLEISNVEKWDPMFVYYLMMQENYTFSEINQIKSLSENGISNEELNYINDLINQDSFKKQVTAYKSQGTISRSIASSKKDKDEFIESSNDKSGQSEDKIIEMNYNNN